MAKLLNINQIDNTTGTFVVFQSEHLWHFSRNICGVSVGTFVVRPDQSRYAHTERKSSGV